MTDASNTSGSYSFWINKPKYHIERVSNNCVEMVYTPKSIETGDDYRTVLDIDTKGYTNFTVAVANGDENSIIYRVQGLIQEDPYVWVSVPGQVDQEVASHDPENMGTAINFSGSFGRVRVQAKKKTNVGRAWASLRATRIS